MKADMALQELRTLQVLGLRRPRFQLSGHRLLMYPLHFQLPHYTRGGDQGPGIEHRMPYCSREH